MNTRRGRLASDHLYLEHTAFSAGSRYDIVDAVRAADPRPTSVNNLFWRNEITLTSSYGGSPADYAAALELIQAGEIRVREMITHRLGLAETGL